MPRKPKASPIPLPSFGPAVAEDLRNKAETAEEFAKEALLILNVNIDSAPKVEHLFRSIGGVSRVMEFVAGSTDETTRKLLTPWKLLTREQQKYVPFEALCLAAGLSDTWAVFGMISAEVARQSDLAAVLINKASRGPVMEATVNSALSAFGEADRKMLHTANGFLPIPKTSITNVRTQNIDATQQTMNVVLAPVEDSIRRLGDRFGTMIMEEAPKAIAAVSEEVLEGDEDEN